MMNILFLVVALFGAVGPFTEKDWSSKKLAIEPKETKKSDGGGREVVWYAHGADPAWGATQSYTDRFTVAKPFAGDKPNSPLLVQLHGRGGGRPSGGIESQARRCSDSEGVYRAPGDFYVLALDSMRDFDVAANKMHEEFWWGASSKFCGPKEKDVPRLLKGETSCEKRVLDTIEWVVRTYKIDRNRIYLCGNSMGGQAALAIGLPHGEIFAAINANVPATIWFPCARMGFIKDDCSDNDAFAPTAFADPPVVVDWSGSDDVWSRNHDVLYRNMSKAKYAILGLWGDYGHCGEVDKARAKNPLVERFDYLKVVKNAAYPVFTNASTDDKLPWPFSVWQPQENTWAGWAGEIKGDSPRAIAEGAKPAGQVNAYFRWTNEKDEARGVKLMLFLASPEELGVADAPTEATADVSLRRIQNMKIRPNETVKWLFGTQKGTAKADKNGLVTVPKLKITRTPQKFVLLHK